MTSPALRARYLTDAVTTSSPARLLVMLYDRLVLDLIQAEAALTAGNREVAGSRLVHAQDIIIELRSSLRMGEWDGASRLARLYAFVLSELVAANVAGAAGHVAACRGLIEPLADAWRQASVATAAERAAVSGVG